MIDFIAQSVARDVPTVDELLAMAAQIGLDDQALDSLFEVGSKIEA